jgi:hypothetical protein
VTGFSDSIWQYPVSHQIEHGRHDDHTTQRSPSTLAELPTEWGLCSLAKSCIIASRKRTEDTVEAGNAICSEDWSLQILPCFD